MPSRIRPPTATGNFWEDSGGMDEIINGLMARLGPEGVFDLTTRMGLPEPNMRTPNLNESAREILRDTLSDPQLRQETVMNPGSAEYSHQDEIIDGIMRKLGLKTTPVPEFNRWISPNERIFDATEIDDRQWDPA